MMSKVSALLIVGIPGTVGFNCLEEHPKFSADDVSSPTGMGYAR
jgi:hypothetical protein